MFEHTKKYLINTTQNSSDSHLNRQFNKVFSTGGRVIQVWFAMTGALLEATNQIQYPRWPESLVCKTAYLGLKIPGYLWRNVRRIIGREVGGGGRVALETPPHLSPLFRSPAHNQLGWTPVGVTESTRTRFYTRSNPHIAHTTLSDYGPSGQMWGLHTYTNVPWVF